MRGSNNIRSPPLQSNSRQGQRQQTITGMLGGGASSSTTPPIVSSHPTAQPAYLSNHGTGAHYGMNRQTFASERMATKTLHNNGRFHHVEYIQSNGDIYHVNRLITEDNTDFDPDLAEGSNRNADNSRRRGRVLTNDDYYVDAYEEIGYATADIDDEEIRGARNATIAAFATRGINIDRNALFTTPIIPNQGPRYAAETNLHENVSHLNVIRRNNNHYMIPKNFKIYQSLNPVLWNAPPNATLDADKLKYSMEHFTIKEFEKETIPLFYMDTDAPESYKTISGWITHFTCMGLYYLGAEYVNPCPQYPNIIPIKLVFGVEPPDNRQDLTEDELILIQPDLDYAKNQTMGRKRQMWDRKAPLSEEEQKRRAGMIDPMYIFIHCIFMSNVSSQSMVLQSYIRFHYYYYTN